MDFTIPERIQGTLEKIESFVAEELFPLEQDFLHSSFKEMKPRLEEKRAKVKAAGLWGPNHPEDVGGMGLTLLEHGLITEVLGTSPLGHYVFGCQAPDAGNIEILHKHGTEEQHERFLQPLLEGKQRSCFSMTEKLTAGSNPTLLAATAEKDGDDYVINGEKWFSTAADGADFSIAMVVTNPGGSASRRASMIIVPCDTPGFEFVRNVPVMGHAGSDYDSHAEVRFNNCRVPKTNLLGREGAGFLIAQERLGPGRIHHCMRWLGICKRSFDLMCERVTKRKINENETLADTQIVQTWVAESAAEIHAARTMVLHCAWLIDNVGSTKAHVHIGMIKFYVAGILQKVIDRAIQAHGALGMTDDTILAHYYRHERAARIYDGPDEVHKISIAKRMLRNYKKNGK